MKMRESPKLNQPSGVEIPLEMYVPEGIPEVVAKRWLRRYQTSNAIVQTQINKAVQYDLSSASSETRKRAADMIPQMPAAEQTSALVAALKDKDPEVRRSARVAAKTLSESAQDAAFEKLGQEIAENINSTDSKVRASAVQLVGLLPTQLQPAYLETVLSDMTWDVREKVLNLLEKLPSALLPRLQSGMKNLIDAELGSGDLTSTAVRFIDFLEEKQRGEYYARVDEWISEKTKSKDFKDLFDVGEVMQGMRGSQLVKPIEYIFKNYKGEHASTKKVDAIKQIEELPVDAQLPILILAFEDAESWVRDSAAEAISKLPPDKTAGIPTERLEQWVNDAWNKNYEKQRAAAKLIFHLPPQARFEQIKKGLSGNGLFETGTDLAKVISQMPESEDKLYAQQLLWSEILKRKETPELVMLLRTLPSDLAEMGYEDVSRTIAAKLSPDKDLDHPRLRQLIESLPEKYSSQLFKKLDEYIEGNFNSTPADKLYALENLIQLPPSLREKYVLAAIQDPEPRMRRIVTGDLNEAGRNGSFPLIRDLSPEAQALIEKTAPIEAVENTLYATTEVGRRTRFDKTGSELDLLDGKFKEKEIVRHIKADSYLQWRKAFEAHQTWKKLGFSYVPIEPILSVRPDSHDPSKVYVSSGVVGIPFRAWAEKSPRWFDHVNTQYRKIWQGLGELGIKHGHMHWDNFCLVFEKNSDGTENYDKPPKVYCIDFDQAETITSYRD